MYKWGIIVDTLFGNDTLLCWYVEAFVTLINNMNNYHFFFPGTIFSDTPKDKVAGCKTEKSKHLQRKNFGTAGE